VGDTVSTQLAGNPSEVLRDQGPRESGHQRVALLIQSVCAERWHHKVSSKLVFGVNDDRLYRATVQCALADVLHVLAALTHVNGKRDNLFTGCVLQPANADGGVEATGIR
jgi:hypothetical protein